MCVFAEMKAAKVGKITFTEKEFLPQMGDELSDTFRAMEEHICHMVRGSSNTTRFTTDWRIV